MQCLLPSFFRLGLMRKLMDQPVQGWHLADAPQQLGDPAGSSPASLPRMCMGFVTHELQEMLPSAFPWHSERLRNKM